MTQEFHTSKQNSPYESDQSFSEKCAIQAWEWCWGLLCLWTPKNLNAWRLLWLRIFGCRISGKPFVHQRARIQKPWNLILHDRACLGDRANAYSLGEIEIKDGATISQEAYLCTGTHDIQDPVFPLQVAKITVEAHAFVGLRAIVLPGVTVGEYSVVGAGALVTRNVPAKAVVAGNPAKTISTRQIDHE